MQSEAAIFRGHIQIYHAGKIGYFIDYADFDDILLDPGLGYWMILE